MDRLEFLKSIENEGKIKAGQNDQLNSEELLNLQKDGLIELTFTLNDDATSYSIAEYWITDKGKQYIKDHTFVKTKKINRLFLIPIIVGVITALIVFILRIN